MNTLVAATITMMMWTADPGETFDSATIDAFKEVCATYNLTPTRIKTDIWGFTTEMECELKTKNEIPIS